jgi:hypothetical protein
MTQTLDPSSQAHLFIGLPLDPAPQFMRYCPTCSSEQLFNAGWDCPAGLLGYCLGCGCESIAPMRQSVTSGWRGRLSDGPAPQHLPVCQDADVIPEPHSSGTRSTEDVINNGPNDK